MFTFRLTSAFVLMLLIGACASPSTTKSAAEVSSSSPRATPTASRIPVGWVTYQEPAWGYSISMPADWHSASAGQINSDQVKSFSNENVTDVTTLSGLDASGILVSLVVSPLNSGCPGTLPPVGWAESTVPAVAIDIDGYSSVVWGSMGQGAKSWAVGAEASSGKYCYSFHGVTLNHEEQLTMTPLFEQMLQTFSFGTLAAPPF
jgi:hypothetical protein